MSSVQRIRQQFLLVTGLLILAISELSAGPAPNVEMPYVRTSPYAPEDLNRVIVFFDYGCPYCARYDTQFYVWGNGFPPGLALEGVPVIGDKSDILKARGFYAAKLADPKKIAIFNTYVYNAIQSQSKDPQAYETYEEAAIASGIRASDFRQQWNSKKNMQAIMDAYQRLQHYRPRVTPSVVVKGQFITDADRVAGDYQLLFQLVTGLLSRLQDGTADRDWFGEIMRELKQEAEDG